MSRSKLRRLRELLGLCLWKIVFPILDRDETLGDIFELSEFHRSEGLGKPAQVWWLVGEFSSLSIRAWRKVFSRTVTLIQGISMPLFTQDIRIAVRSLSRDWKAASTAIVTLALAIGANTAVFSSVSSILLAPLPYAEGNQLVSVWTARAATPGERYDMSFADFAFYRQANNSFNSLAASGMTIESNLALSDGNSQINVTRVTENLFETLGVFPIRGPGFSPDMPNQIVLSHSIWTQLFGGAVDAMGKEVFIDGNSFEVVGVMPEGFSFLQSGQDGGSLGQGTRVRTDAWTVMEVAPSLSNTTGHMRNQPMLKVVGRLAPGTLIESARVDMEQLASDLRRDFSENRAVASDVELAGMLDDVVSDVKPILLLLLATVALVLFIASVNVASLAIQRAGARRKEITIRAAIGGSRGSIIRQLATESTIIALAGSSLGVVVGMFSNRLIVLMAPQGIPRLNEVGSLDLRVLAFAMAVTTTVTLITGILPALPASRVRLADALGGKSTETPDGQRFRSTFVAAQVALATVLMVGAGLLTQELRELTQYDIGFDAGELYGFKVAMPRSSYPDGFRRERFFTEIQESLEGIPGVSAVAGVFPLPFSGKGLTVAYSELRNELAAGENSSYRTVTSTFFDVLNVHPIEGRFFEPGDAALDPIGVVIDQHTASTTFGDTSPVGRTIWVNVSGIFERQVQVLGVAPDIIDTDINRDRNSTMYFPYRALTAQRVAWVLVRSNLEAARVAALFAAELPEVDRTMGAAQVTPLANLVERQIQPIRFAATLVSAFGGLAVILSFVGVFGTLSSFVDQHRRGLGIRAALGASRKNLIGLVVRKGLGLVASGVLVGCVGAYWMKGAVTPMLAKVGATDPMFYGLIGGGLLFLGFWVTYFPARRAAGANAIEIMNESE
jgi:putative ABC transport system permease protein